jgi:glycosyltransferase involved in cell wall biosynthesis
MIRWLPAILILPYLFLFLRICRSLLRIKTYTVSFKPVTFVSIVIACKNEQNNLPLLLKYISLQDYPRELFEVIVVDDNSSDGTFETGSGFREIRNLIVRHNEGSGKKQAIRSGISASSGALIITTDADCMMATGWLKTIVSYYEKYSPDMIICPVELEPGPGFFRKFQQLEFLSLQGVTSATAFSGEAVMCNGANLAFTRQAYMKHCYNLYDAIVSGDDIFLVHSLKREKASKILWLESTDAKIITAASSSPGTYLRQRMRWISKGNAYSDRFTILLGIVTFVTIILEVSLLAASVVDMLYIWVFLVVFFIKSIPDFLILVNTTRRYDRCDLMKWFLPVQLIYPFYVLSVTCFTLFHKANRRLISHF